MNGWLIINKRIYTWAYVRSHGLVELSLGQYSNLNNVNKQEDVLPCDLRINCFERWKFLRGGEFVTPTSRHEI